jgi:hypothetical protein
MIILVSKFSSKIPYKIGRKITYKIGGKITYKFIIETCYRLGGDLEHLWRDYPEIC